ncbi:Protein of unknown function [Bacillus cereus]|nr:Protein of unknown function [Bacillus cereus]
MDLYINRC